MLRDSFWICGKHSFNKTGKSFSHQCASRLEYIEYEEELIYLLWLFPPCLPVSQCCKTAAHADSVLRCRLIRGSVNMRGCNWQDAAQCQTHPLGDISYTPFLLQFYKKHEILGLCKVIIYLESKGLEVTFGLFIHSQAQFTTGSHREKNVCSFCDNFILSNHSLELKILLLNDRGKEHTPTHSNRL